MLRFVDWINAGMPGVKTTLAAVGLIGLAIYQVSEGQYEQAVQSMLAALAALGIRHAVARVEEGQA